MYNFHIQQLRIDVQVKQDLRWHVFNKSTRRKGENRMAWTVGTEMPSYNEVGWTLPKHLNWAFQPLLKKQMSLLKIDEDYDI